MNYHGDVRFWHVALDELLKWWITPPTVKPLYAAEASRSRILRINGAKFRAPDLTGNHRDTFFESGTRFVGQVIPECLAAFSPKGFRRECNRFIGNSTFPAAQTLVALMVSDGVAILTKSGGIPVAQLSHLYVPINARGGGSRFVRPRQ